MAWFDNIERPKLKNPGRRPSAPTPEGLWKKCDACGEILQASKLEENQQVCLYCDHHFRLGARERLELLLDAGSFKPLALGLATTDPLQFNDRKLYKDRLKAAEAQTQYLDSCVAGVGQIDGQDVAIAIMNFEFMGGSMGTVTGEKIALAMDTALAQRIPCIVVSCSGGARMQEGILSLMQMAKTSAVRSRLKDAGVPYISVLTDPTTGGCAASFAMLGDLNLAEPKALIGFAGPRVIEQSIRQVLPEGFQRSEFLLEHGQVDRIVPRRELKKELSFFIRALSPQAARHGH